MSRKESSAMSEVAPMPKNLVETAVDQEVSDDLAPVKLYYINVAHDPLLAMYRAPDYSTLVWPGTVDFHSLDGIVFHQLPSLVSQTRPSSSTHKDVTIKAHAAFIRSSDDSLHEFDLDIEQLAKDYIELLQHPLDISFVRYDVTLVARTTVRFSFTAENTSSDDGLLTLLLPSRAIWSVELLSWILRHHSMCEWTEQRRVTAQDLAGAVNWILTQR